MYEAFYGLTGKPFQLNPDPTFFFPSSMHRRARSYIEYGMHQAEGFIVITGEVGAGKTTVVRSMLARLDPGKVVAGNLVSTQLDADDTLRLVASAFGVQTRGITKSDTLLGLEAQLVAHASQGRRCLLIVDEAQNLTQRAVEELRMLSNFQLGTHALLQTFLVGQPEFRHILQNAEMNQVRQRVIAACHIGPLSAGESRLYIEHRLSRVGWSDSPRILPDAFLEIHQASGGIPRRINLICDRLLLSGFLARRREFCARAVRDISKEIADETSATSAAGTLEDVASAALSASPERINHQIENLESGVRELEETLSQMDHRNAGTAVLLRRFVDLLRKNLATTPPK